MENKTLFDLEEGETAIIQGFDDSELPSKLYELGIDAKYQNLLWLSKI